METIKELEELRSELYDKIHEVNKKINESKIALYDFTNKFIKLGDYGYMYVTWQKFEDSSSSFNNRDEMFFQGLNINYDLSDYQDSYFVSFSPLNDVYIPLDTFLREVQDGEIKEITKEEFISHINKMTNDLVKNGIVWVNTVEQKSKEQ